MRALSPEGECRRLRACVEPVTGRASQRDAITRCARARGEPIKRWFAEKQSAKTLERPVLAELREAARRGDVRVLYVFRLDRLGRSGIRDMLVLLQELRGHGCRVVTVADGFDLEGPLSEVVIAVMAWAAQWERLALGQRIAAARVRVEASGGSWGRPARAGTELAARALAMVGQKTVREISVALKIRGRPFRRSCPEKVRTIRRETPAENER